MAGYQSILKLCADSDGGLNVERGCSMERRFHWTDEGRFSGFIGQDDLQEWQSGGL